MEWTIREFGIAAAVRYDNLVKQALRDIAEDPVRSGSVERPEIMVPGARTYHLEFSRRRVTPGVKKPRHLILYRERDGVIEVARILHDSRDLARHLPQSYRRESQEE
jgi:toxin ParE1/3/4